MAKQIPSGWIAASLSEIASKLVDGSHNPPAKQAKGLPMLSALNINHNKILFSDFRLITEADFKQEDQRTKIVPGDVLLTIVGAIGRTAVVPEGIQHFTLQRSVAVITPVSVSSKFLMYQIESPRVARYFTDNARGTAQKGVYLKTLGAMEIWLPPLPEQHRIVAKIEELFSELDKGVDSLKTAREQLKVYRQALLKHAFEGKLTAQWRAENGDKLETASALQQRIQTERQERHRQQLADWEAKGKQGSKPKTPKPLPPLTTEERAELPELPTGWVWAKVGNIGTLGTGVTPLKGRLDFYENGTIAWVTSGALNESFVSKASAYVTQIALKETNLRLYPKHTLLVALYGEGKTRGKCSELLIEASTNQAIAAIPLEGTAAELRQYVKWFFQKNYGDIRLKSSGGVQPNLNLGIIENTLFPMCSLAETKQVVDAIETKLSEADQLDQTLATALQQSAALRQSILKKAFCGQLVKQDKNDEPAAVLLERIRAEKLNGMKPGKREKSS